MSDKEIKLTDKQISKFSAWLTGKFSTNAGSVFNVKSIGELYKRALVNWLVKSPKKVERVIEAQLDAVLLDIIGVHRDQWGYYKIKDGSNGSRVRQYLEALADKYMWDHEQQIVAKAHDTFGVMLGNMSFNTINIKRSMEKAFQKIVDREIEALDGKVQEVFALKVRSQLQEAFKEIQEDVDFADPNSLKTEWAELMAELHIMSTESKG